MNTFQAFSIFFHVCDVDYNLTKLRKDHRYAQSVDQKKHGTGTYHDDKNRILENYPELKELLELKFDNFFRTLYGINCKNKITTSWMVKLEKGEEVHRHNHKNCQWSGVLYYGKYDNNSCPLMFENPLPNLFTFHHKTEGDCSAYSNIAIPPKTGQVVFFPAFINHYSQPHNTNLPRQSLAFNLVPTTNMISGDSNFNYEWLSS